MTILQFTPFQSAIDATFWHSLVNKKLDILQLSQDPQPLQAYYSIAKQNNNNNTILPPSLCIPGEALEINPIQTLPSSLVTFGSLINTNTLEQFQSMDKNKLFQEATDKIWRSIQSGNKIENSALLNSFLLLTFADLKKYKFYYWFAFPALLPSSPWLLNSNDSIETIFNHQQINTLTNLYHNFKQPFFIIQKDQDSLKILSLNEAKKEEPPFMLGFYDPSLSTTPGWPLRNFLAWADHMWHDLTPSYSVLCYRESNNSKQPISSSRVIQIELSKGASYPHENVKAAGWERNVQGKLGPRMADLGPLMDPTRLADSSVDLNLKLMRWRVMPELNLEKIKETKCLLLGAGTLGCYVARSLLGWGVRHITFVDNGKVSFSNPVRQPLYRFEDCLNGGASKADIAAQHLLEIQPTMTAKGYSLSIPMPGHPNTTFQQLNQDVTLLMDLFQQHDVIFLLTDSRESRWLPTLLGMRYNKMVINAALGFDTYLVMRHGSLSRSLGCYFCNDIVAPTDSLTDRTLDQQCTVTRPGLSAIAAALAVELMVSLLQHKKGIDAEADTRNNNNQSSILGLIPHQIRGFLAQFNNMLIVGQSYEKCTACSKKVIDAFDNNPLEFIQQVTTDSMVLEKVTGLEEMKKQSEALLNEDWIINDEEDEDDF